MKHKVYLQFIQVMGAGKTGNVKDKLCLVVVVVVVVEDHFIVPVGQLNLRHSHKALHDRTSDV